MLNLNAMFGSCESIFESETRSIRNASSTELQLMEMEIVTDLARTEVDSIKASATMSQLDQLFNMYNHVKQYGIDRTFLSLYNTNGQLNNMLGAKFPSCESVNSVGNVNSNMSTLFIAAMEEEGEGIFAKIGRGIKWIWEKLKHICSVVWNKILSWFSSDDTSKRLADALKEIEKLKAQQNKGHQQQSAGGTAEPESGLMKFGKGVLSFLSFTGRLAMKTTLILIIATAVILGTAVVGIIGYLALKGYGGFKGAASALGTAKQLWNKGKEHYKKFAGKEDYSEDSSNSAEYQKIEKQCNEVQTKLDEIENKFSEATRLERIKGTFDTAIKSVKDMIDIENKIDETRTKVNATVNFIKSAMDKHKKALGDGIESHMGTGTGKLISTTTHATQKLMKYLFIAESKVRKACSSVEKAIKEQQ